ncbi:MAG: tRNA (adenosine(37)-N6)-dimethylallyltransferase MiaA [Rhodobacteraceae bacterium]|nr:MAG: tRNA (adenosine(37)-N6)-dimethylallyltransferase MiaA [Paracoccaceae bacterium]
MSDNKPILIAGPTASGKSHLALDIAQRVDSVIINADALQVYQGWSVLTARPTEVDLAQAPHALYGHVSMTTPYSVGAWLRDVQSCLADCRQNGQRPIIIGGTGLYFLALTQGLAEIPAISSEIRGEAEALAAKHGKGIFADHLERDDAQTHARIDALNPARTQRAWEVLRQTGVGLSTWQDNTPAPLIAPKDADKIHLLSDTDWLNARIEQRFDQMVDLGALDECRAAQDSFWDETLPSCKAIGAKELISHLKGECELTQAIEDAKVQTRQYAKRQRSWFRGRMSDWQKLHIPYNNLDDTLFL